MQLKLSAFVSAACLCSVMVALQWSALICHVLANIFFFLHAHSQEYEFLRRSIALDWTQVKQRGKEVIKKKSTHSEKCHFSPKMCIFSDKCYLVERRSWFYSVIQCIFFFFVFFLKKRSEKVFFWASRTKTPAEKVLARMLTRRTGTLHHSANAAPSFLISSNLWFKGLQAILAPTHQRISWGGVN